MKHLILLCLMLLPTLPAAGQAHLADSLVNVLNTQQLTAGQQLELYGKICQSYVYSDSEKVIDFAKKGLTLAEKEKDKYWLSRFNDDLGKAYTTKAQADTALIFYNKALAFAAEINSKDQEASIYTSMSVLYNAQGNITAALESNMKALAISEETGNKKSLTKILASIASIHHQLKNPERALHYAHQAEAITETVDDDPIGKMNIYYVLGGLYTDSEDKEKGLAYLMRVNEISRAMGNKAYEAASAQSISVYYGYKEDYEKAIEYANESLRIGQEIGDRRHIIGAYCTLSDVYGTQDKWKECEATAGEAWKLIDPLDVHYGPGLLYKLVISNIYLDNKDKAADYLSNFHDLCLKRNDENFHEILMDMEVKYETEKKETRIATLEKERQLYVWLGIAGFLLVLALLAVLWQTIRSTRKEKQLIATRSVLDGEMKERTRLARDLHDRLSGNLSAVKIELNSQAESLQNVRDKLDNCIRDIRGAAHDLMPTSLQFGLKVALGDFAAQFPNVKFHFFGEEKRIDERAEFVIYCCANELVNNAIKHSGAANINLQLVQDEKHVTLTVSDDGCGYDEKATIRGFGLKSIRDRVASCNGKMDIVTSPGKGTETTIELKTSNT